MVADVACTGEWSPVCVAYWWDEAGPAEVGKWFSGRNVTPERTWEARSQITVADRGREPAWAVGAQIADRTAAAHRGIPVTLAAIKNVAERG
ncbi:hypothetical protein [Rhodococcus sp. X156]|uniref:hypothetical protein n=1 Tax=Rhodococcus sp. X156 TaxID=2499145 RepID=UPI0032172ECF